MESKAIYNIESNSMCDASVIYISLLGNLPDETLLYLLSKKITEVMQMSKEELLELKGITPKLASRLISVFKVHEMLVQERQEQRTIIQSPDDAASLVMEKMRRLDREHFKVLLLNTKNQVLSFETISVGTLNSSVVHPREVFKVAIKKSAASVILLHNHPSGEPAPSREDISITKRLIECGETLGINVLDHIIIGDGKYASLKEQGLI
ncbi:MAG: DNA repair protein RadC [Firmicutes bacterium]|nr:DNA repair protein RadC [Bacillota bacterium]